MAEVDPVKSNAFDQSSFPEFLPIYYKYIFPFGPYYQWLRCTSEQDGFAKREFSFTLQNDIYVRYQSFADQNEMEKEIQRMNPYKIDIGAVYSFPPKDHKRYQSGKFKALTKELVFDIDMTDYDDVRTCCQGTDICKCCWTLMKIAIKILDKTLRADFGFKHLLFIYSGRRGVHCWVCDKKARKLSSHARSSIVEYLSLIKAGKVEKKVALRPPVHPFIRSCLEIVKNYWDTYGIQQQGYFDTDSRVEKILMMIPDENLKEKVQAEMQDLNSTAGEKWSKIRELSRDHYALDRKKNENSRFVTSEIMLECCFPRLDVNVSKGVNHLLKSPFSVHPKTGRVCVPIDPNNVDNFDPFNVPVISELCNQVDSCDDKSTGDKTDTQLKKDFYKKTRLVEYMGVFDDFLKQLKKEEQSLHLAEKALKEKNTIEF